ncbi:Regulator of V-ATPase in vacuolar membrane protein 1 [Hypsizygus marmoreus]|uniref:Regulator of V-ATPase in vacuolar membrane protein 1 n=1 Tax=Hypsizygus marmoreus TaxID=39966 RepID=A0A369K332_HYPMA|nr:Regulator of V-ATPase in vacuolar membrane protein 1 [Hypsizygus marmoreus]
MLHLCQAYAAYPPAGLCHLAFPDESLLLYPSADAVIIVNASSLSLRRVLAFSEAFPGTIHAGGISCLAVDSGMKLIVAALNTRIAAWSLSGIRKDAWRIHSTLSLPENHNIVTVDSKSGLLAVGTQTGLSVYTLILENDLPTWSQKWTVPVIAPSIVRFAPSLMYIATITKCDNAVRLYSTTSGRQTQIIPHPRPISNFSWRHSQAASRDDLILYTATNDSTIRIFIPVLDSPQHLQLHVSLDLFASLPFSVASNYRTMSSSSSSSAAFWLDREVIGNALTQILKQRPEQDDARSRRIKEIKDEGWDLFLRVLSDGSVVVTAVANIDRRPPTLLKQFTLQQLLPMTLPGPPSYLSVFPNSDPSMVTLAISSPLAVFNLSPMSFFDAQSEGLHLTSKTIERIPAEESEIVRFVRTPEGRGVGVLRTSGGGETWRVVEHGARLVRSTTWKSADHVIVLQGGRTVATYSTSESVLKLHSTPYQCLSLPPITYLIAMPSQDGNESIIGITPDFSIVHVHASHDPSPSLILRSQTRLPLAESPSMILPVDPMAWGLSNKWIQHDVLLSVSEAGELAFWVPEGNAASRWRFVPGTNGDELTIWDSQESEFATGMEFRKIYSEPIEDLDWTSTPDIQSILAVGFLHRVELVCQQRMTYFDEGPGWATCTTVDIGNFIPYQINDSIWLVDGSLLLGAGHQMLLYGGPSPSSSQESLFEYVARQNGPLDDYHPQMLLQCLLWDKVELVKQIIVNLSKDIKKGGSDTGRVGWTSLPVEKFLRIDKNIASPSLHRKRYTMLFNGPQQKDESDDEGFTRPLVAHLIEALEACPLPHLTPNEQAHLLTLIQTTLEIDEQRRALDANGLRYLISMRSFYILNRRASAPSSPESKGALSRKSGRRERLRYRDMIWAFHSESQDLLLSASTAACNGKVGWSDARALGIPIWLTSIETLKAQMEVIARNEYMSGDNRDPTACSLFYFALGKVKLVHGLWRQAAWHKEQTLMLKFLSNDFTEGRWRTAALKNAFALLSKRRFEYAAAFFLLGGALKDAVNVCIKQLGDFQLAVAIARVVEQSNEGPILLSILSNTVLPIAFKDGNRWLGGWAFWLLNRRDMAVRILLTPLQDIATAMNIQVEEIGEPHYDDPSLALLFSQLRSKTLQTAKGTSEISGRSEFNFVLQMSRVFCRMGCHVLALDLVRSWSFDRPSVVIHDVLDEQPPTSPTLRRSKFDLSSRRRSIMIDMQLPSQPPTRSASPERPPKGISTIIEEQIPDDGDLFARKVELGNLMKSAKQDVKVPEFDMSSFF